MKTNTAAVLALCAVAISAMPSTMVPEEVEHLPHGAADIDDASPDAKTGADERQKTPNKSHAAGAPAEDLVTEEEMLPVAARKVLPHYAVAKLGAVKPPALLLRAKPSAMAPRLATFKPLPTLSHTASVIRSLKAIKPLPASDPRAAIHRTATQQLVKLHSALSVSAATNSKQSKSECSQTLDLLIDALKQLITEQNSHVDTDFKQIKSSVSEYVRCTTQFKTNVKARFDISNSRCNGLTAQQSSLFEWLHRTAGVVKKQMEDVKRCQRNHATRIVTKATSAMTDLEQQLDSLGRSPSNPIAKLAQALCSLAKKNARGRTAGLAKLTKIATKCNERTKNPYQAIYEYLHLGGSNSGSGVKLTTKWNNLKIPRHWFTVGDSTLISDICALNSNGLGLQSIDGHTISQSGCKTLTRAMKRISDGSTSPPWWTSNEWKSRGW